MGFREDDSGVPAQAAQAAATNAIATVRKCLNTVIAAPFCLVDTLEQPQLSAVLTLPMNLLPSVRICLTAHRAQGNLGRARCPHRAAKSTANIDSRRGED